MQSSIQTCLPSNNFSFIEENHEYKLNSQARQSAQIPQPGRPSQDMMSFWGKRRLSIPREREINILKVTNSRLYVYFPDHGVKFLEIISRTGRTRLSIIMLNTVLL